LILSPRRRLVLYGSGGVGVEAFDLARQLSGDRRFEDVVFLDDAAQGEVDGAPILRLDQLRARDGVCVTVSDCGIRAKLVARCGDRSFASLIADSTKISPSASVGEGAIIFDHCLVNAHTIIGRHFICLYYSHISHDCRIGDFVTFGPRVSCCGAVEIGDRAFVGAGAILKNGSRDRRLRIGAGATIGMGAVVIADVPDGAVVVGNPARVLGRRDAAVASDAARSLDV
jgi:sugar O-acyltransferase (sialic acid O-acetyltransferase NeuD family)